MQRPPEQRDAQGDAEYRAEMFLQEIGAEGMARFAALGPACGVHRLAHFSHRGNKPHKNCATHDGMANV